MRISDWSSDVCSSDLAMSATKGRSSGRVSMLIATLIAAGELKAGDISAARDAVATAGGTAGAAGWLDMGKAADLAISGLDRQAARAALEDLLPRVDVVVQARSEGRRVGKDVSVRVDLGGRRIIKKEKQKNTQYN